MSRFRKWRRAIRASQTTWRVAVPGDALLRLPAHAMLDLLRSAAGSRLTSSAQTLRCAPREQLALSVRRRGAARRDRGQTVAACRPDWRKPGPRLEAGQDLGGMRRRALRLRGRGWAYRVGTRGATPGGTRFAHQHPRVHGPPYRHADAAPPRPGRSLSAAPRTGATRTEPRWVRDEGPGRLTAIPAESARAGRSPRTTSARVACVGFRTAGTRPRCLLRAVSGPRSRAVAAQTGETAGWQHCRGLAVRRGTRATPLPGEASRRAGPTPIRPSMRAAPPGRPSASARAPPTVRCTAVPA